MRDMTKAELEAELRQARDKICYCECKNKELQERLSAIVAPVQCDTYAEAVRAYGKQSQLVMAMEEMSELTKELSKNLRGADNGRGDRRRGNHAGTAQGHFPQPRSGGPHPCGKAGPPV